MKLITPNITNLDKRKQFRIAQLTEDGHEIIDFRVWRKSPLRGWHPTELGVSYPFDHIVAMYHEAEKLTTQVKNGIFTVNSQAELDEIKEAGKRVNRLVADAQREIKAIIEKGKAAAQILIPATKKGGGYGGGTV